jgi:hypothetical protein
MKIGIDHPSKASTWWFPAALTRGFSGLTSMARRDAAPSLGHGPARRGRLLKFVDPETSRSERVGIFIQRPAVSFDKLGGGAPVIDIGSPTALKPH